MAILPLNPNNLHEFGVKNPACSGSPWDEADDPILDEGSNLICEESIVPAEPFAMEITLTSTFPPFEIVLRDTYLTDTYAYNFVVDWGDGSSDTITSAYQAELEHPYASSGTYIVTITGQCESIKFPSGSNPEIRKILSWGRTGFRYLRAAFADCYLMTINEATDTPDFSNCTTIQQMFFECRAITTGAENWDFSGKLTSLSLLFDHCDYFNSDCSGWNTTGITDMYGLFNYCQRFNNDISGWDTSAVTNMGNMFFFNAQMNHISLASLDTSACTNFVRMLAYCTALNVDIGGWTIPTLAGPVNMTQMFNSSDNFNKSVDAWDVSAVTNMSEMFQDAFDFNQDFLTWDTSAVTDMSYMFNASFGTSWGVFNGDISNFDTSSVITMRRMLANCNEFNQDIGGWDVSEVTDFELFMSNCYIFNQNLNLWNVSKAVDMRSMFANCFAFNGNVTTWTPIAATDMDDLFNGCSNFNQDISGWDITGTTTLDRILSGAISFSTTNYDLLLNAWSLLTVVAGQSQTFTPAYTIATSQAARDILTTAPNNWTISDGGGV